MTEPQEPDWRAVLEFERDAPGLDATRERALRERFGVSPARYHQALDRALERPEALEYDPSLVLRLRRVREDRRRRRTAIRLVP